MDWRLRTRAVSCLDVPLPDGELEMAITYRMHSRDDEEALRRLWSAETGWGDLTPEDWQDWYINTPAGEATIAVAEDQETGEIVGQFMFIPCRVSVNRCEVNALRPYSPILARAFAVKLRISDPLEHPVAAMYLQTVQSLRDRGGALIYMLPDPRWQRFFRMFPFLQC